MNATTQFVLFSIFLTLSKPVDAKGPVPCGHNFDPDSPVTSVGLCKFDSKAKTYRRIESLSGKSLASAKQGKDPLKILFVPKGSKLAIKKLTEEETRKMNRASSEAAYHLGRTGLRSSSQPSDEFQEVRVGNHEVGIERVTEPRDGLFKDFMKRYKFESDHAEDMERKLRLGLENGFDVVVVKAKKVGPGDPVNIGIETVTEIPSGKLEDYIDHATFTESMNNWISRPEAGGRVTLLTDVAYNSLKDTLDGSPTIFFKWGRFYGNLPQNKNTMLGRTVNVFEFRNFSGQPFLRDGAEESIRMKIFEEKFVSGQNDGYKLSDPKYGGSIFYRAGAAKK